MVLAKSLGFWGRVIFTYQTAYIPTCQPTYLPSHPPTTYLAAYLPSYCLPADLPAYRTNLLTLPTYRP